MTFLFFVLLALCIFAPFETFGDGTEFAISSATLGISHPPSYPLFVTLSKLFYFLPFGNIALRINLFSAVTAALVAYVVFKYVKGELFERLFLSLFTFFSKSFFVNAMIGEAYALNLLFFIAILFLSGDYGDKRRLFLSSFLLGLGSGNHHTILFLVFFIIYKVFKTKGCGYREVVFSAALFIFGFSVYLYLPIRAVQNINWNWGRPVNYELFINSFLRHDFKPQGVARDWETFFSQIVTFNPFDEFGVSAAIVVIIFTLMLFKTNRKKFLEIGVLILLYSVFIVLLLGNDSLSAEERKETYAVFFIPAYFLLGYGAVINQNIEKRAKMICLFAALTGLIYHQGYIIATFLSFDNTAFAHDLARAKLMSLPKDGVLLVRGGEHDFPILYQQKVTNLREDVKVINLTALGKRWNARESLEVGTTYTPGFEGEKDSKKQILKAVLLFQKDFKKKKVFLNIFDESELPETLSYHVTGLFYSLEKTPVTMSFVRERSLKAAPPGFAELLRKARDFYEQNGYQAEARLASVYLNKVGE